jgi:hypothetical protein
MIAPTTAQAAARRLELQELPRRTHEWHQRQKVRKPNPASMSQEKISRARKLEAKGWSRRDIGNTLGVPRSLLALHLGRKK